MLNSKDRFGLTLIIVSAGIILISGPFGVRGKVCGSIDIQRSTDGLVKLDNCSTIEGNLTLVLIDITRWEDYEGGFPELVEITGELLFFRVRGLKSLGQLFPNLAVIGGERLVEGYALVVYEMFDLEDIGLSSLTLIRNGAVRIEKNPRLCHLGTVDWGRITTGVSPSENFFKGNNECADTCPSHCNTTDGVRRCWNRFSCQKMLACRPECPAGFCNGDTCCHPNCVGGCSGPSADQCTACKNVVQTNGDGNTTCTQKCSPGLYMFSNRRCFTADECLNFDVYRPDRWKCDLKSSDRHCTKLVTMHDGKVEVPVCYVGCPKGYIVDLGDSTRCIECKGGQCPKVCNGKTIDSLHEAEDLKDCKIIHGSLIIKLKDCVDENKLEHYLGQIVEVTGHIAVFYSYALHSLYFFKSLRKVGGETLINHTYSIHILDNPNLQELIPDLSRLEVSQGTVLFRFNGKLSSEKISDFVSRTNLNIEDTEVSETTNGNQLSSAVLQLHLKAKKSSPHVTFITLSGLPTQNILHYSIFWKETSSESVTVFDEADACTEIGWQSKDRDCIYSPQICSKSVILNYIVQLKPWTRYAAYIRARTTTTVSAVSNVVCFMTDQAVPSVPMNLNVKATEPGTLHVTWDPPSNPNGNVTNYKIKWTLVNHNYGEYEDYRHRDYCTNPLPGFDDESTECCPCSKNAEQQIIDVMIAERKANLDMLFQDWLRNIFYAKRLYDRKRKGPLATDVVNGGNPISFAHVYNTEEFIITNLGHYQKYRIDIQACHDDNQDNDALCSENAIEWGTTLPNKQSDLVDETTISIEEVKDGIQLRWTDPPHPNGIIITYDIENMRTDLHQSDGIKENPLIFCLLNNGADGNNFIVNNLPHGDYQFRIRATSLAGPGPWTHYLHYTVSQHYECYRWSVQDIWAMGSFRTPMKERDRCEDDLGYVFTQGFNDNFPGCQDCWCCKPLGQ